MSEQADGSLRRLEEDSPHAAVTTVRTARLDLCELGRCNRKLVLSTTLSSASFKQIIIVNRYILGARKSAWKKSL